MESFSTEFEHVLEEYADKNAITYLDEERKTFVNLTYKDVKEHFEIFCKSISENVIEEHCCVALLMDHNPYIPGLIMSLQKLGHCFIFLSIDDSDTKHVKLLERLNVKWLISFNKENHSVLLDDFHLITQVELAELALWKSKLDFNVSVNNFENILYVISTSGTTGANKIVKVQNYCIYSNVKSIQNILNVTSKDVIYFGTSLTFDPSMIELFLAVITGATLLILPRKIHANPRKLFENLFPPHNHRGITILQMSPSVFLRFNAEEIDYIFQKSSLKILCLGGENFPTNLLSLPRKNEMRIFNLYGITEVSCWASICEVESEMVHLGTALAETLLEVRDENGICIQEGVGEMFIGSKTRVCLIENEILSNELNKRIFRSTGDIVQVHNNTFTYIGRKNDMIKRYGTRIVLTNIETKIFKELQLLNKCLWHEQDCKLLLFFIIRNFDLTQKEKIIDKLRVKLLHFLPKEHFPDFIDILKTLPITRNGKLDTKALCELFLSSRQLQPHSNGLQVFNELLLRYFGVSQRKTAATLLEMGANSIVLLQFFEEFKIQFNGKINSDFLTMLFEKHIEDCRTFVSSLSFTKAKKRKHFEHNKTEHTALNLNTLIYKTIWKYDMKACVDCSPIVINKSKNQKLIAVGSFAHVFAIIDAHSGSKLTEVVLPDTIEAACSTSACKSFVYVGCFDTTMYCIKIADGSITWKFTTGDRLKSTPSLCRNSTSIVFGSYDKHLYCLNTLDGSLIWKTNLQNIINTQPLVIKKQIFVATITGKCFCVTESDGSVVWEHCTEHPVLGSPCFMEFEGNSFICWPNVNGNLNCFSCRDGKLIWKYQAQNQIFCSLLHYNGLIIFGCHDKYLHCLQTDNKTPSLKFKTYLDAPISSTSCIFNNKFIVTPTTPGSLFLINLQNGEIESHINLGAEIFSSPCVCDSKLYIGCRDNNLYCIEINESN